MLRIGSVECTEWSKICEKEKIESYPTYRVYPPAPIPSVDLIPEETLDTDKLKKAAFRYIGDNVIDITAANHDIFKDDNPGRPKVLLFSESKKHPIVFRALSTYFDVSLIFRSDFVTIENFGIWNDKIRRIISCK